MRRMSFAITEKQILNQTKTVTRRMGWKFLKPGDLIQPVYKSMGLKKGEKQKLLGDPIRILSIRTERLIFIKANDVELEGFPELSTTDFIDLFTKANSCGIWSKVQRIRFEYTSPT